jgi:hypothetical protein
MTKKRARSKVDLARLTPEQQAQLGQIERDAILEFAGPFEDLEKAIGILRLGHHLGWKPLVLIHSKRTIAKFEGILNIQLREIFPAEGPSWSRSVSYSVVRKVSNFWKAVSGETPVKDRQIAQR